MQLRARRPQRQPALPALMLISTPLKDHLAAWSACLRQHPDLEFTAFIFNGIEHGFRVSFDRSSVLRATRRNLPSAQAHPEVIDKYLGEEMASGRMPVHSGVDPRAPYQQDGRGPQGPHPREMAFDY